MLEMTGAREAQLMEAANTLLDARRTNSPITDLPPALRPESLDEVYFIQDRVAEAYGRIGGWKIGAPSAEAAPTFAPMPLTWMAAGGSILLGHAHRYRGIEAEVAFLLGEDLPARAVPYRLEEIFGAIASCHPAIETLESAFVDPAEASHLSMLADLQMHGGLVFGPACGKGQMVDWSAEHVTLAIDGTVRVERTGSNTSGNLFRLLPYLANEGAQRTRGLRAGQWITTGSWTGNTLAVAGSSIDVRFSTLGRVTTRFE